MKQNNNNNKFLPLFFASDGWWFFLEESTHTILQIYLHRHSHIYVHYKYTHLSSFYCQSLFQDSKWKSSLCSAQQGITLDFKKYPRFYFENFKRVNIPSRAINTSIAIHRASLWIIVGRNETFHRRPTHLQCQELPVRANWSPVCFRTHHSLHVIYIAEPK